MSRHTEIQWADSTLNLQMGCSGCELWKPAKGIKRCYAGTMTERLLRNGPLRGWPESFDKPKLFPERLEEGLSWTDLTGTDRPDKPWLNGYPRMIFCCDMGDPFDEKIPLDWLAPILPKMEQSPHIWMFLTKRPSRAAKFFTEYFCPLNVWIGTSLTGPQKGRLEHLMQVECATRFLSYEPAWKQIDWPFFLNLDAHIEESITGHVPDWIIIGGESEQGSTSEPFETGILDNALTQLSPLGIKVFIKQLGARPYLANGAPMDLRDSHGGDWNEWPERWRVRQMPDWKRCRKQNELALA